MLATTNRAAIAGLLVLLTGVSVGCGRQESPSPAASVSPVTGSWQPGLPASFAGLTVQEGGACYLDMVNSSAVGPSPIAVKSGAGMSLGGWAVADVASGRAGSPVGVQLTATGSSYSIAAERYARPGLAAALKGPASLDAGGLKLDSTPLNVPPGDYRARFLIQSDRDLIRCDTNQTINVQ